ncbi:LysE family translocator [Amycolatopsis sp. RM579]|uniref:LysE family translocator n=2 Tax=Amycolatopsis pithecellobii TaxID=664692 RepID=A0A6N7Z668_9PSEU|nr:LysE family translocator [Amycolatopsis pithecellobii]
MPGANQLLGLSNAVRYGPGPAIAGLGGRLAALAVLVGLVAAGLGAVLAASAATLTVIKWVGVVYLAWIGISAVRQALRSPIANGVVDPPAARGVWPVVTKEFVVAISNPKALLMFAALLPQFTTSADGLVLLGAGALGIELVVGLGYITVGSVLGARGIKARAQRRLDVATGVCFLGIAGLLAAEA